MLPSKTSVAIVGGGPCGLMLANELGRRGVQAVLVDEKPGTAFNPQANATQARTMEHFRRLGFADAIRRLGLPGDFPTDIAYSTRYASHELARFQLPSAQEALKKIHALSGSWSAAELPHRVSQKYVEAELRRQAEKLPGISINYGWKMTGFRDLGDSVCVDVERLADGARQTIEAAYLVGADGPRSLVREQLGFRYNGETGIVRDFMGGRMYAIYARAPDFYRAVPHAPAWMNVCFNPERRAFMATVDGKGEFAFHTQLKAHEREEDITDQQAREMFQAAVGLPIEVEILSRGSWTAGHSLVAEHFQKGRVFLGGDAVHLFTPTGGLGYNTAVEDAVNLGWKLAAVLKGSASPTLLDTYEAERRPLGIRNTGYARKFADSLGLFKPESNIEDDSPEGAAARAKAGVYLAAHGRAEFNIPGVTFGGRYDGSPAIVADGSSPPPDSANEYIPCAVPGGRPPHIWLDDGRSLYDAFGFEWTLLCMGPNVGESRAFADAASRRKVELEVVHLPQARELYEADYALIRPDQIVAWRGDSGSQAGRIFDQILGTGAALPDAPAKKAIA
ncbi:MAG TPA: FAD-dependent oxidoreductase [Eoetvoesiella sp.]|uniref:FAD-dependent oxidoreductase n=1 Tax=Eoetvoesiella sp. TaxID=1966355 RepID=UPI002BC2EDF6|nr:FAD-dependent oxidoreductase [Eoetvoesiella sp.]HWK60386.1 FAD-dependent oxidoreductase [Eoetvoesiella sp.]